MAAKPRVTLRAQWLGQQLRLARGRAKMTLEDVADYLQRNSGTVSRFESGEYPIRRPDLLALLDLYRVNDERSRTGLLNLANETWKTGWWDSFKKDDVKVADHAWIESQALTIHSFDVMCVPGLFQTRTYAEALVEAGDPEAPPEKRNRWIDFRMTRQQILDRKTPPKVTAVLDEAVLRRCVGGVQVMRAQLQHLLKVASGAANEIRVLPFEAGAHPSTPGPFTLLEMPVPLPIVGYMETPSGAVYVEADAADMLASRYDRMLKMALSAEDSLRLVEKLAADRE